LSSAGERQTDGESQHVTAVAAGHRHSIALTADGKVFSFGRHQYALGHGETESTGYHR
jgi:alpha-tubulin suppressor-like RCC1 family protein